MTHLFALGKLRAYVVAKLVVQVAVSHAGQASGRVVPLPAAVDKGD